MKKFVKSYSETISSSSYNGDPDSGVLKKTIVSAVNNNGKKRAIIAKTKKVGRDPSVTKIAILRNKRKKK